MADTILEESIGYLEEKLGDSLEEIKVERIVFGLFFTGVKLSNGQGGVSYTPLKSLSGAVCCPSSAAAMPSSGQMEGKSVSYFLDDINNLSPLKKTLAIAVINALANTCWKQGLTDASYRLERDMDPIDKVEIGADSYSVVVGALVPYIKQLINNDREFSILELDPSVLKSHELEYYLPPKEADKVLPKADYVIITGTTLINDTLEELLELVRPETEVIVVGPTVGMLAKPFLKRQVSYLGGVEVTDSDRLLDILGQAGSGYHFFGKYAGCVH